MMKIFQQLWLDKVPTRGMGGRDNTKHCSGWSLLSVYVTNNRPQIGLLMSLTPSFRFTLFLERLLRYTQEAEGLEKKQEHLLAKGGLDSAGRHETRFCRPGRSRKVYVVVPRRKQLRTYELTRPPRPLGR